MIKIFYFIFFVSVFISCSKHESKHEQTHQEQTIVHTKDLYSVRVFNLFHPHEINIRLRYPDRFRIRLSSGVLNAVHLNVIRVMQGDVLHVQIDSKKYISSEFKFITPSENLLYDEFEIEIAGKLKRKFVGGLQVKVVDHELEILVMQKREHLVASVISSETSETDPLEYLKAMSVVSRSYILSHSDRHVGYDFCDNTHCQIFYGNDNTSESYQKVVMCTSDEVITSNRKIFPTLFSAACGGGTIASNKIWAQQDSSFSTQSVMCTYCSSSKYYHWERSIHSKDFFSALNIELKEVRSIVIDSSDQSVPNFVKINYSNGMKQMTVDEFRLQAGRVLGWNKILSNKFSLSITNNRLVVVGNGFGHNSGLCQEGAKTMAQKGKSYLQIISYYFPTTKIDTLKR